MYTDADLTEAVESGALTPQAAAAFRAFVATKRPQPGADEEQFRLLTGFNDIFVAIAIILVLVGTFYVGIRLAGITGAGLAESATAWGLALHFTARRRMALPSIILVFGFLFGLGYAVIGAFGGELPWWLRFRGHATLPPNGLSQIVALAVAAALVLGAWIHWRRFKVPITIACMTAAALFVTAFVIEMLIPTAGAFTNTLTLVAGLATFAYAMRWDLNDPTRTTRRADVAFWLHLLAAPLIVQPIFAVLHVLGGIMPPVDTELERGAIAIALYFLLIFVALITDRRAILASALIYIVAALDGVFRAAGVLSPSLAVIGLAIGAGLLLLSAFWNQSRASTFHILNLPPNLRSRLPPIHE